MKIVYFSHSVRSCWNHGNAHFQRGVLRALQNKGHEILACEAERGWSHENLIASQGKAALEGFTRAFSDLPVFTCDEFSDLEQVTDQADVVIVHEWNEPALVSALGVLRSRSNFTLLFHDTHHRAVSDPNAIKHFDLAAYDAVLAFGRALAEVYEGWGWAKRVFIWHEAVDTSLFHPPVEPASRSGAVWVGNWGDGERSQELEEFLLAPACRACIPLNIHGVRYPDSALSLLNKYGAQFNGWLPNTDVPKVFSEHKFTVHIPRRFYTDLLPGIPTIRVFEALGCGIPLIISSWEDSESLFRPGKDYLVANTGQAMEAQMRSLMNEPDLCSTLAQQGLSRIHSHHSCKIRADELLKIVSEFRPQRVAA